MVKLWKEKCHSPWKTYDGRHDSGVGLSAQSREKYIVGKHSGSACNFCYMILY